jgi:hypothetical protein
MESLVESYNLIELEHQHGAHDYHPIPAVLERGEGRLSMGCGREKNTTILFLPIPP